MKRLIPRDFFAGRDPRRAVSESELTIRLATGAEIITTGLDVPERIEGIPIDWICIDEFGNVKKEVWTEHIRPALSEREGQAWLIGVPEGRNHYYDTAVMAQEQQKDHPELWSFHTWPSADILPPQEIELARYELDTLTFQQEYEASFVVFSGRAYYSFDRRIHCQPLRYHPELPLIFCFDFNVAPGVCAVLQEQIYMGDNEVVDPQVTACIGEIWIPENSNTRRVCQQLIQSYSQHQELVFLYGDATGGARGTAKVEGSDWDLVKAYLGPVFGNRLRFCVPSCNPQERVRVNAMNSRLMAADGTVRFLVHAISCPHVLFDFEGVTCKKDGSGDIDKESNKTLSHVSDAIGYYVAAKYPLVRHVTTIQEWR